MTIFIRRIGENNSNYGKTPSEETRKKMSEAKKDYIPWIKGKKVSDKTKQIISDKAKERNKVKIICLYCKKEGRASGMKRWHFDNCKFKNK